MSGRSQYTVAFRMSFIQHVKQYPELWDKCDIKHRDTIVCNGLWEEVSKKRGITRTNAKKLWKSLLDCFRKIYFQYAKKTPDNNESYIEEDDFKKIRWPFFQHMLFVAKRMANQSAFINVESSLAPGTDEEIYQDMLLETEPDKAEVNGNSILGVTDDVDIEQAAQHDHDSIQSCTVKDESSMDEPTSCGGSPCHHHERNIKRRSSNHVRSPTCHKNTCPSLLVCDLHSVKDALGQSACHSGKHKSAFGEVVNELMTCVPANKKARCMRSILDILDAYANDMTPTIVTETIQCVYGND